MQPKNKNVLVEDPIDLQQLLYKYLTHWRWFLISVSIACSGAYLFVRFTNEVYSVSSTLMIGSNDEKPMQFQLPGDFMYQDDSKNLGLQALFLQSFPVMFESIKKLDWRVSYYSKRRVGRREIYGDAPFLIQLEESIPQCIGVNFDLLFLTDSTFQVNLPAQTAMLYNFISDTNMGVVQTEELSFIAKFGQKIIGKGYSFTIHQKGDVNLQSYGYQFCFNDLVRLTKTQKYSLSVVPLDRISALQVSASGENIKKVVDFLNSLNNTFVESNLRQKNRISNNTIDFVNHQLAILSDSLSKSGRLLRDFRQTHNLLDVNMKVSTALGKFNAIVEERASLASKLKYYTYLLDYVNQLSPENKLFAPSALGIEDPALTALIERLVYTSEELNRLKATVNTTSEYYIALESQVNKTKNQVTENLQYNKMLIESSLIELKNKNKRIESEIDSLPGTQHRLIAFEREYKINDQLYTFLLQKKAEAQLTLASSTPDHQVIEFADSDEARKIAPKGRQYYLLALLFGIGLPFAIIELISFFDISINSQKDVERLTHSPIVGKLLSNSTNHQLVMLHAPKSTIAESFRTVRTNLQFLGLADKGKAKVILITSALGGDGKTFVALNLAASYSLNGKKTALLGFDLRKPRLHRYLDTHNKAGLSTYYSGLTQFNELGHQVEGLPNLNVFLSGPIPPNPAELVGSSKTNELFESLKKEFDIVIVDTPPVALVTDAYLLMEYAHVNLCVVRQKYTDKRVLRSVIADLEQNEISVSMLINDVDIARDGYKYGYRYGYGYKYGYKYGYGETES